MELYLAFLNLGDFLHLIFSIMPILLESIFSMWQTWAFIAMLFVLMLIQSTLQYFLIDKNEEIF